jgi:hypothetical protein
MLCESESFQINLYYIIKHITHYALRAVSIGHCSLQEKALQKGGGNQEPTPSLSQMAALLVAASAFIIISIVT